MWVVVTCPSTLAYRKPEANLESNGGWILAIAEGAICEDAGRVQFLRVLLGEIADEMRALHVRDRWV